MQFPGSATKSAAFAPVTVTAVTASAPVPVSVNVIGWAMPDVPASWLPKFTLPGMETDDCTTAPESGIVCGLLAALSVNFRVAVLAGTAGESTAGANVTFTLQELLAERLGGQLSDSRKSEELAPVTEIATESAALPGLETFTAAGALDVPADCAAKAGSVAGTIRIDGATTTAPDSDTA